MEPIDPHIHYEEAASVGLKIIGALIAFFSFRWLVNIFKGDDDKLDPDELKKMVALIFFLGAAGYMIYKDGTRDHEWPIYSELYLAIVFGALLVVLHLESALDKILAIIVAIRSGVTTTTNTTAVSETKTETETQTQTNNEPNPPPGN